MEKDVRRPPKQNATLISIAAGITSSSIGGLPLCGFGVGCGRRGPPELLGEGLLDLDTGAFAGRELPRADDGQLFLSCLSS